MIPRDSGKRSIAGVILATAIIWSSLDQPVVAQQGGTANYFYDSNGRLTAVLSPTGDAAIYNYDPAGNFTSITRSVTSIR
jgi:YD repeat-containing protein